MTNHWNIYKSGKNSEGILPVSVWDASFVLDSFGPAFLSPG